MQTKAKELNEIFRAMYLALDALENSVVHTSEVTKANLAIAALRKVLPTEEPDVYSENKKSYYS